VNPPDLTRVHLPKISRILFVNLPNKLGCGVKSTNNGKCMKMEYSLVQIPEAIHGMTREKLSSSFLEAQMEAKDSFGKTYCMCGGNVFVLLRFVFPERVTDPFILQARSLWFTTNKG
jgi:hypothetical protein